jgi:isochorismate synthase
MKNSFCLYRLPNQEKAYFLEGQAVPIQEVQSPTIGFVFAPFFNNLNAYILQGRATEYTNETINAVVNLEDSTLKSVAREAYVTYTNSAINTTTRNGLAKIVMARNQIEEKPDDFNPIEFFDKMRAAYPQAFVYLWYSVETGMWMGATPEVLIENKANSGTTMALAGTRTKEEFYDFSEKEIEEQRWVYQFIHERLESLGCKKIQKEELESFGAGNLVHLMNRITFEIDQIPDRWKILQGIHPTPAVAGYPQLEALSFIEKNETFSRKYYSGYLGPYTSNRMNMFVNLRCMQVHKNKLELFAGAGITSSSNAEKEWLETNEKLKTLLQLF